MIDPGRPAVDLDLRVLEILHTWTGDSGAGVRHDRPKFSNGIPIPIGVGEGPGSAARAVVGIPHVVTQFVSERVVHHAFAIRHAKCVIREAGTWAVRHDIGDAAIAPAVVHDQGDQIGLVLITQLMKEGASEIRTAC